MAGATTGKKLQDEVTCPICLEYFDDPVALDCDHSFCRACITQTWGGLTADISCPQCRRTFPQGNLRPDRKLRSIVEAARELQLQAGSEPAPERLCEKHQEPLKLFCREDEIPICLVCDRSKGSHRDSCRGSCQRIPANVTLDPDTAHPRLVLSEDGKRVRWTNTRQPRPDTPERFDTVLCVLGREGFTSGRHYWEVEVGDGQFWSVGAARESVNRKGQISLSPKGGIWAVGRWDEFEALTDPLTPLPLSPPSRIRVSLDCDRGQVTFIDAGTEAPIFTFPPGSLPGERIRPWIWEEGGTELQLCP